MDPVIAIGLIAAKVAFLIAVLLLLPLPLVWLGFAAWVASTAIRNRAAACRIRPSCRSIRPSTDSEYIRLKTPESDRLSKELAALGFKFVGSTIVYAYLQAVGCVNDHLVGCFRHREIAR